MTAPLALAYVRVSTVGQVEHGASLSAQEAALRGEAARRGWAIEVVREEGKSAKDLNRLELQSALRRLDAREAQILLAVRLDRVSRSVSDFAELIKRSQKKGWAIAFTSTSIDTTNPSGKFSAHVMVAAAEFERDLIGARTREGMAQRKAEGAQFGRKVDAESIPTYRRILGLRSAGWSLNQIARQLNEDGVPTARGGRAWYPATVRAIVNSETARRLCGESVNTAGLNLAVGGQDPRPQAGAQ